MALPTPPPYNQLDVPNSGNNDCGQTDVAAALTALGRPTSPSAVVAHGPAGETDAPTLMGLLNAFGSRGMAVGGPISEYLPGALGRTHYCIVGIQSDAGGNPSPGSSIGHWLLCYGEGLYLNPYGGRLVEYADLSGCDLRTGVEIMEDPELTTDITRSIIRVAYWAAAHREPDEAGLEFWSGEALRNGLDATLARMVDSGGELDANLLKDAARDAQ